MTDEQIAAYLYEQTVPPETPEPDRLAAFVSYLLRDIANDVTLLLSRPTALSTPVRLRLGHAAAALFSLIDALHRDFAMGLIEAHKRDDQREAERVARETLLQQVQDHIVFIGGGTGGKPPEAYTIIGWHKGRAVALSRDGGLFILAAGVLGSGKSQAALSISEGLLHFLRGLNSAQHVDTSVMSFHVIPDNITVPEVLAGLRPNPRPDDIQLLKEQLALSPQAISHMRLVMPDWLIPEIEKDLRPYLDLGLELVPLRLRLPQLGLHGMAMLLGEGRDAAYVQCMLEEAQARGEELTLEAWEQALKRSPDLDARQKRAALRRLRLLRRITSDHADIWDLARPGVYTAFSLGGRWIKEADTLPLMMALMTTLNQPSPRWGPFQRFFVMDEINRYVNDPFVVQQLLTCVRQVRHRGSSLMVCGQDFKGLPDELLALASICAVFELRGIKVWEHIKERIAGFSGWRFEDIMNQSKGVAVVSVADSSDPAWRARAQQMYFRPPLCEHGGHTRTVL